MSEKKRLHAGDMEVTLARHFDYRQNLIVPNVYYGLGFWHELDLLIVRPSGYAVEVEIKVSLSDLKADKKKRHQHHSNKIKLLYFAVPEFLEAQALELIPERAGLLIVYREEDWDFYRVRNSNPPRIPTTNRTARKLTEKEINKLGSLATLRIWSLKECLYRLQRQK